MRYLRFFVLEEGAKLKGDKNIILGGKTNKNKLKGDANIILGGQKSYFGRTNL
jgi:hypothetical protein